MGTKPLYETNLESWYQMLVVLTGERTSRNYSIGPKQAELTTNIAVEQLLIRLKQLPASSIRMRLSEAKLTMLLASISLRCMSLGRDKCMNDTQELKDKLIESVQEISQSYRGYGKALRQTLVALILNWVESVREQLGNDEVMLEYLLVQACGLAASDIEELREAARNRERKRKPDKETEEERKDVR